MAVLIRSYGFAAVLVFLILISAGLVLNDFNLRLAILAVLSSIAVLGLYFAFGLAGLIHLAQSAFVGVGAYSSALLTARIGLNPWLGVFSGMAAAGLAGALFAYPMHRTRTHYLALTTVGFSVSFVIIVRNWESLTGGYDGLGGIPLLRLHMGMRGDLEFYYISLLFLGASILAAVLLRHSHFGRALVAIRDDEFAAAASGVNVAKLKRKAFILCSIYGGLSGALYAHYSGFISPDDFELGRAIMLLSMLIIGGEFHIAGAVVGSFTLTYMPEWLRFVGRGYMALFGVLMLLVLMLMPNGIVGALLASVRSRIEKRA
jgi:branched-chain amino acid transport system permease protein